MIMLSAIILLCIHIYYQQTLIQCIEITSLPRMLLHAFGNDLLNKKTVFSDTIIAIPL